MDNRAGSAQLIGQLEYTCSNGTTIIVPTDKTLLSTVAGLRLESSWFGAEVFEARQFIPNWSELSGDHSHWEAVNTTVGPGDVLTGPHGPGLTVVDTLKAVFVKSAASSYVFDFGVNFAGRYTFTLSGCPAGHRVVFRPSEKITPAGLAEQSATGSPIFDGYTCNGSAKETTYPKFMYHGSATCKSTT